MIATGDSASHEEAWLALPWLANGRISQAERDKVEPHVRGCAQCREELAFQRLLCNTLTAPERVTYAPGPSFRKLMERIDSTAQSPRKTPERNKVALIAPTGRRASDKTHSLHHSLWRPPGLAWAASFVLMVGLAGMVTSVYRQSQTLYKTHTDATVTAANVLHISFDRQVTIGEAEEVLRSTGARIVEGPDSTGIFGVTPGAASRSGKATTDVMNRELHLLAARLRTDPRVRWVEPVPDAAGSGDAQSSAPREP